MSSPTPSPHLPKIPEDVSPDLPITLTASVVLTALPRDGKLALDAASHPKPAKGLLQGSGPRSYPSMLIPVAQRH